MKSTFLQICLGVTMILLSLGFLIRSISTVNAAPEYPRSLPEEGSKVGKYTFQYIPSNGNSSEKIIIWDTETAKSMYYYYNGSAWAKAGMQFPQTGVGE